MSIEWVRQREIEPMAIDRKFKVAFVGFVFVASATMAETAFAVSVEVAKKCDALTAQAFPPRVVGNPAAGSAKGSGREERAYYKKCVSNNGKMDAPRK
jgi:hypothetical protein